MNNDWQKMVHTRILYAVYTLLASMFLIFFVGPISMMLVPELGFTFNEKYASKTVLNMEYYTEILIGIL